ncbi:MAG: hypothetical protein P4L44_12880 [Oryzomonas sp.]|uniref:hypothetical protein n=1 Tax=Oryzomonas sp. TaxID=2855186 RepID=UPI00284C12E5|nr:hypothetical protein [Oryzomonas sp.]MDR3580848.1 hypothetical protein [Oryzomonas sp.]
MNPTTFFESTGFFHCVARRIAPARERQPPRIRTLSGKRSFEFQHHRFTPLRREDNVGQGFQHVSVELIHPYPEISSLEFLLQFPIYSVLNFAEQQEVRYLTEFWIAAP